MNMALFCAIPLRGKRPKFGGTILKALPIVSLVVALAALGLVLMERQTPAATPARLGFVRTGYLMEHTDIAKEAREKVKKEQQIVQENLKKLEEELTTQHEAFLKEQEGLSVDKRKTRIKELAQLEENLNRYRANSANELGKKEQEIMGPTFQVLNTRIATYAKREGYTLIWGTLSDGNILYGADSVDLTEPLVTALNAMK